MFVRKILYACNDKPYDSKIRKKSEDFVAHCAKLRNSLSSL